MNIWIITLGEPLPIDPGNARPLRSGILVKMLGEAGHQVTWWTSTFDHWRKQHRFSNDHIVMLDDRVTLRLLHGSGYHRNVSLARLIDHRQIAQRFRDRAGALAAPDLILCSLPTLELSLEAVRFAKAKGIPAVLDVRDLWPDIFVELAPAMARPLARALLLPYFRMARAALAGADAVVGINEAFVAWGIERAGRERTKFDRAFPMAYPSSSPSAAEQAASYEFWRQHGVVTEDGTFKAIFLGTVGRQFDFETVVRAARALAGTPVQFILCGTGELLEQVRAWARDLPGILLPGWVGAAEIWTLMRFAHVGLAPYQGEPSFTHSLPNKALEYLSAGLPIVSSLPGALAQLLADNRCGLTYPKGDAQALCRALETLRKAPQLRREMAGRAQALYDAAFRAECVYADMIAHLQRIAEAPADSLSRAR